MTDSTLIIGGGVAGIQAALDLANRGVDVYLVERESTLGGRMAQLDRVFPTNENALCLLAPKMAECFAHPNILLLTGCEVQDVSGDQGDFNVKVLKRATLVDEEKCTGCGECLLACPVQFAIVPKDRTIPMKVQDRELVDEIIENNSYHKAPLIPILIEVNEKMKYLPKDVLGYISYKLDIPLSKILRVATFYKAFSLELKGKFHIKVCLGTACHVRGARKILETIQRRLEDTKKGLFSLETVNCLGTCAMGPVIVVNEEVHGNMTQDKIEKVLTSYIETEEEVEVTE